MLHPRLSHSSKPMPSLVSGCCKGMQPSATVHANDMMELQYGEVNEPVRGHLGCVVFVRTPGVPMPPASRSLPAHPARACSKPDTLFSKRCVSLQAVMRPS